MGKRIRVINPPCCQCMACGKRKTKKEFANLDGFYIYCFKCLEDTNKAWRKLKYPDIHKD